MHRYLKSLRNALSEPASGWSTPSARRARASARTRATGVDEADEAGEEGLADERAGHDAPAPAAVRAVAARPTRTPLEADIKTIRVAERYLREAAKQMGILHDQLEALGDDTLFVREFARQAGSALARSVTRSGAAFGGGTVGSLILPGPGTAVGALVGGYVGGRVFDVIVDKTFDRMKWPKIAPNQYPRTQDIHEALRNADVASWLPGETHYYTRRDRRKKVFGGLKKFQKEGSKLWRNAESSGVGIPFSELISIPYDTAKATRGISQEKAGKLLALLDQVEHDCVVLFEAAYRAYERSGEALGPAIRYRATEQLGALMDLEWGKDVEITGERIFRKASRVGDFVEQNRVLIEKIRQAHRVAGPYDEDPLEMWRDVARAAARENRLAQASRPAWGPALRPALRP
ncbi:hypothetical protein [Paraburkholderia aspalathi]|uniref:hypothetical protein n=1 Tax=Paraburkholderia aspalathi TaxID=1324617 RepID=UPI0038BA9260